MKSKYRKSFFAIVIGLIIIGGTFLFLFFPLNHSEESPICNDIDAVINLNIVGCYDAYSNSVYLEVVRGSDLSKWRSMEINFFDFSMQSVSINDIPNFGRSKLYKLDSDRNPLSLNINFIISEDECDYSKDIRIGYCSSELSSKDINSSLVLVGENLISKFTPIMSTVNTDTVSIDLIDKDSVWIAVCQSNWKCDDWEFCIDDIQKRSCIDVNGCTVPTNIPKRMKYCEENCEENWQCDWTQCEDGFSIPHCKDLNKCGTVYNVPSKVECRKECVPNIVCEDWNLCVPDYNFLTLSENEYLYGGVQSRICKDSNKCTNDVRETQECSTAVDVYIQPFTKCGEDYIGLYNNLDDSLIANLKQGNEQAPYVNIDLSNIATSPYCNYCFNGILDGDEIDVDCGGSCMMCEDRRVVNDFGDGFLVRLWKRLFK